MRDGPTWIRAWAIHPTASEVICDYKCLGDEFAGDRGEGCAPGQGGSGGATKIGLHVSVLEGKDALLSNEVQMLPTALNNYRW